MSGFRGKTVLITGSASGIGKIVARLTLERGAERVVLWDIDGDALHQTTEELSALGTVLSDTVDVSSLEAIQHACEGLREKDIRPHTLINNAGIVVGTEFWNHSHGDIDRILKVNTHALMHIARFFLPQMIEDKGGHIVNISSAAGMLANPKMSVYAASKWAVLGWSESLRLELEQHHPYIDVTTVTPSYISTGMFAGVKTHWMVPIIEPEKAAKKIVRGIEKKKILIRMPWSVYLLPILKGLLPLRWFDLIAGKWLKVYRSMDEFKGRNK